MSASSSSFPQNLFLCSRSDPLKRFPNPPKCYPPSQYPPVYSFDNSTPHQQSFLRCHTTNPLSLSFSISISKHLNRFAMAPFSIARMKKKQLAFQNCSFAFRSLFVCDSALFVFCSRQPSFLTPLFNNPNQDRPLANKVRRDTHKNKEVSCRVGTSQHKDKNVVGLLLLSIFFAPEDSVFTSSPNTFFFPILSSFFSL